VALAAKTSIFGSYEFVVRRLHSLTGLVPIGGYLFIHLATNDSIMDGGPTFQSRVDQIHSLGPTTLLLVEWFFIFLPILFHGLVGLLIVSRGERNVINYPYPENVRYTLQRWTGVIAFAFILWHVFQMHGWFRWEWWQVHVAQPLGGARFDPHNAAVTAAAALQASPLTRLAYVVGVSACVYHLANGLWTMGITWGVWTSPRAQRWANIPCAAFGVLLAITGIVALWGMLTFPVPDRATPATPRQQTGQFPAGGGESRTLKAGEEASLPRFSAVRVPTAAPSDSPISTAHVVPQAHQGAL
jgi:succinate dehydrogenase / fumarate reductase cytochrome b subunit